MNRLMGRVQPYAWGSVDAIPHLLGVEPTGQPQAELWLGAHHGGPSALGVGDAAVPLPDAIARAPEAVLGQRVHDRFGPNLPFLLKVLAAAEPLSLQAHPSMAQAQQGFDREDRAGVPIDAPHRSFRDRSHKPELICALTDFWALCGFRDPEASAELLDGLDLPALAPVIDDLDRESGTRRALERLLRMEPAPAERLARAVAGTCEQRSDVPGPFSEEHRWAARLGQFHPGDIGVVTALLLNLVRLRPGQALFLPAGNLHAYLEGTGVEIMANSDNVLRGGLTPKHVDIDTLLDVVVAEPYLPDIQDPRPRDRRARYVAPVPEFGLERIELDADDGSGAAIDLVLADDGPEIFLCVSGDAHLSSTALGQGPLRLVAGEAAFVRDIDGPVRLGGVGTVFRASCGDF